MHGLALLVSLILVASAWVAPATGRADLTGRIVVAGYGPELPLLQDLGRAFEKQHPGTAVDFEWDRTVRAVDLVKDGTADLAVTDHAPPGLEAHQLAQDGIAVIVNFANPLREVTLQQIRDLFTGRVTRWSDLDGAPTKVVVYHRAAEDNVARGFEQSLGITEQLKDKPLVARTDQKALRAVSGNDAAISYLSLAAALKAQEDGIPIRILTIDKIDPGPPTVRDGRYPIRRPLLLLSRPQSTPLVRAFLEFVRSPAASAIVSTLYVPAGPGTPAGTAPLGLGNDPTAPASPDRS